MTILSFLESAILQFVFNYIIIMLCMNVWIFFGDFMSTDCDNDTDTINQIRKVRAYQYNAYMEQAPIHMKGMAPPP